MASISNDKQLRDMYELSHLWPSRKSTGVVRGMSVREQEL